MDLPVMSVTGGIGGTVGKAVSRPIINNLAKRYMLSGISEEAAKGIASRVIQQSGLRWGIRTASEAANFAALEGAGSAASQLYATDNIDAWKVIEASGKGAATGAVMGLFGIVPEKTQSLISKGLGKRQARHSAMEPHWEDVQPFSPEVPSWVSTWRIRISISMM